jgi:hypothetical protein
MKDRAALRQIKDGAFDGLFVHERAEKPVMKLALSSVGAPQKFLRSVKNPTIVNEGFDGIVRRNYWCGLVIPETVELSAWCSSNHKRPVHDVAVGDTRHSILRHRMLVVPLEKRRAGTIVDDFFKLSNLSLAICHAFQFLGGLSQKRFTLLWPVGPTLDSLGSEIG